MPNSPNTPPICPRMTTVGQPSALDPKAVAPLHVVRCQGPQCALFLMDFDAEGKPTGSGHCADTVNAIMTSRIAAALDEISAYITDESEDPMPPAQGSA